MRGFLVGTAIALTLIYWLGANSGERATTKETPLPSAGNVVQERKPATADETQVLGTASLQGHFSAPVRDPGTEEAIATAFVRGKRVALREGPGKNFPILDRYNVGPAGPPLGSRWRMVACPRQSHTKRGVDRIASPKFRQAGVGAKA